MGNGIGNIIKKLREQRDWTQRELARRANINYSVLSRIESGKRPVEDSEIKLFADIFDVSADYLLGRTNDPSPKESDKKMNLFFYDGLEGYEDLSPEEQEAFREHMYEEARQAIELVKKLKKKK
ncbi:MULTISPECIES: helix-turn-helix domain-containing protein [Aneurinibacillus]|uniref:Helix-turn-helix domain-containing protein n=1 Tax=Aneurinibacillus thermoaerophilus TaxID=143495 RepID=A0ABX8YEJ8_ANETH|nr:MULTISPECIES: helix-turn-helix transcriptional regulator [Aneurinibacillus]AMA74036.1 hypothetical protein ACH33_15100 [Aneurinibacillus sp. XH2]MED0675854.1 helix-turn-helix transcriptional regulator [Aneurinibacillus thermoaerophilus]MED0737238.1 helix-turn-helix transcriptional regulator [Aneurinibacillus thermoaerophilus]QYY43378.1 helix-turn-helix domain-containing protein [Aneurinibacillus thermoaerophilus]